MLAGACALAAISLTASGGSAKDSGFKIMMTPKWTGFPYFEAAARGGKDAADELGDTFVYAGADHADVSLQVETLQNFLTQKPDAITLAAIDLNAVAPVLKEARKDGIVVTTFDADAAQDARDMFVNQMSYKQAAKTMLDCALMDLPDGGEVAFVAASPTAPNHTAHIKFMKEYIANDPKYQVFKVVDTQYANDDDAKSYDVAVNLMQAHPNLKVIISSSAVSAPAAHAPSKRAVTQERSTPQALRCPTRSRPISTMGRKSASRSGIPMSSAIWRSTQRISSWQASSIRSRGRRSRPVRWANTRSAMAARSSTASR